MEVSLWSRPKTPRTKCRSTRCGRWARKTMAHMEQLAQAMLSTRKQDSRTWCKELTRDWKTILTQGRGQMVSTRHSAAGSVLRVGREPVAWAHMQLSGHRHLSALSKLPSVSSQMSDFEKILDQRTSFFNSLEVQWTSV